MSGMDKFNDMKVGPGGSLFDQKGSPTEFKLDAMGALTDKNGMNMGYKLGPGQTFFDNKGTPTNFVLSPTGNILRFDDPRRLP